MQASAASVRQEAAAAEAALEAELEDLRDQLQLARAERLQAVAARSALLIVYSDVLPGHTTCTTEKQDIGETPRTATVCSGALRLCEVRLVRRANGSVPAAGWYREKAEAHTAGVSRELAEREECLGAQLDATRARAAAAADAHAAELAGLRQELELRTAALRADLSEWQVRWRRAMCVNHALSCKIFWHVHRPDWIAALRLHVAARVSVSG
jgi:hypothetical protein